MFNTHLTISEGECNIARCEVLLTTPSSDFPALGKIKTTTTNTIDDDDREDNERPTTPTSLGQMIPEIGPCPPAPRKPKPRPINRTRKRNNCLDFCGIIHASSSASRLLDFSKEIEAMYPPHLKVNLGLKIKKARTV